MNLCSDILEVFNQLGKPVPDDDRSIVKSGILDSLSILELVNALEERFDIFFEEEDLTLDNFDNLTKIEALISSRLEDQPA